VNALGSHGATQINGGNADLTAVKHLLSDFRERLQTLDCELRSLYVALDGPPGMVVQLADEICNGNPLPVNGSSAWPASVAMNSAQGSIASSAITAPDSTERFF
jgi:hypothetical protein